MGIKGLNNFLKGKVPDAFRLVKQSDFANTRIVVDGQLWSHANFSTAYNYFINDSSTDCLKDLPLNNEGRERVMSIVLDRLVNFLCDMMNNHITVIFVFDGTSVLEKVSGARQRRQKTRDYTKQRIDDLRKQLEETDPLFRKESDKEALKSLYRQQVPIKPDDISKIKNFLNTTLQTNFIEAPDESEKYCAYLCAMGFAVATWTTDSDTYSFGCPLVISGIQGPFFKVCVVPVILKTLGLTRQQFIDFCIMLECDFNSSIPGIGPQRAWKLIEKAKNSNPDANRLIEIISTELPNEPWELLNAERCREIFLNTVGFPSQKEIFQKYSSVIRNQNEIKNMKYKMALSNILNENHIPRKIKFSSSDENKKEKNDKYCYY